jgi:hypothetical protein
MTERLRTRHILVVCGICFFWCWQFAKALAASIGQ